jgi:hypothetical protein
LEEWVTVAGRARQLLAAHLKAQPLEQNSSCQMIQLFQVAIILEDRSLVSRLTELLRPASDCRIIFFEYSSSARHLGAATAFLAALRRPGATTTQRCVCAAKSISGPRLLLAELLLNHYRDEHDAAIEHLDFAIAELRDMKIQPALERALRHRGLLKA